MGVRAKVFGAGSVGNHLANACRLAKWDVAMVDRDPEALARTKDDLYPKRYGKWDESIKLHTLQDMPKTGYDVIFVGTPPDVHLQNATQILKEEAPRVLQIEKPLCSPTLVGLREFLDEARRHPKTKIVVGYNHLLAANTLKTEEILNSGDFKDLQSLDCEFRSHWENIFKAHHWLSGPKDTYLGFWERGGGAGGEHSHGLNLWQHFAHVAGAGRVKEVSAIFDFVNKDGALYDRLCFINLITENGLVGRVAQDVITSPKKKFALLQFSDGSVEWQNDVTKTVDQVIMNKHGVEKQVVDIEKTRSEEFFREISHIQDLLDEKISISDSPICLQRGLDTMLVLAAAHKSYKEKKTAIVNYDF